MSNPVEDYMVHILEHLKTEHRKATFRQKERPETRIDFMIEGRVNTLYAIISTVERDLNYLRGEFQVEDSQ